MEQVFLLAKIVDDPALTASERAVLRCEMAREHEERGDYEAAREALAPLWQRVGERPRLEGLDELTASEVLLRAGALSGWIGSTKQLAGAQETAKNLISESISSFERLGDKARAAEAQIALGYCYWREGAFDEARITINAAIAGLSTEQRDLKVWGLVRASIIEQTSGRLHEARLLLNQAAPLAESSQKSNLSGRYHLEHATTLKNIGFAERNQELVEQALLEYAAASFYFEQADNQRYVSIVENQLGFLYFKLCRYAQAHEHLNVARRTAIRLKDDVHRAQYDETLAQVLLAEGRNEQASVLMREAVRTLEKGDEGAVLAESLATYATSLSRLKRSGEAQSTFRRSVDISEFIGDKAKSGTTALIACEELINQLALLDLRPFYERACELLSGIGNQDADERIQRLASLFGSAERHFEELDKSEAPTSQSNQSALTLLNRFEELAYSADLATLIEIYQGVVELLRPADYSDEELRDWLDRCEHHLRRLERERTRQEGLDRNMETARTGMMAGYDFYPDIEIRSDFLPHTSAPAPLYSFEDPTPFAHLDSRVIHDRYGKYIAMLDSDLETVRCPYSNRVIARKLGTEFYQPSGELWAMLDRPLRANFIQ